MTWHGLRIRARGTLLTDGIALHIVSFDEGAEVASHRGEITMKPIPHEERTRAREGFIVDPEPAVHLTEEQASQLSQDLWDAGIRPPRVGSPGHLAALEAENKYLRAQNAEVIRALLARAPAVLTFEKGAELTREEIEALERAWKRAGDGRGLMIVPNHVHVSDWPGGMPLADQPKVGLLTQEG